MHYWQWGTKAAPVLILLHGAKDHGRSWDAVAETLCQDYRVIVPDLRGHGDSDWSPDGDYGMLAFLYDFSQLIEHLGAAEVSIVAHSLGGNIALRYTGLYPQKVTRVVAIEGLGPSPEMEKTMMARPVDERLRDWIDARRAGTARAHKKYKNLKTATARMQSAHPQLSPALAAHLTRHGARKNRDGSYSWKYDTLLQLMSPVDIPRNTIPDLWARITCPVLLCYGGKSWASNPKEDGRMAAFKSARLIIYDDAGHWVHHDQYDDFVDDVSKFLEDA